MAITRKLLGFSGGTGRIQFADSVGQVDSALLTFTVGSALLSVGSLTSTLGATLHLLSDDDLDIKILLEENGQGTKPWYIGIDASDSHNLVVGCNSSTVGSGTIAFRVQPTTGDVLYGGDMNFTKSGTQTITKEGTGSFNFRTAATGQEISFRPKLLETLTLTDDNTVGICKICSGGATYKLSFHNATAVAQQTVTGSRGGNAALADLLTKLANTGLIVDGTS